MVNKEKTKYVISCINYNQHNLAVNRMFFKRLTTFKYLGVELSANDDNHRKIHPIKN